MAQLAKPNADAALRTYLIELRTELRALFTNTLLDAGPDWARYAWTECSKGVDPLIAGEAVEVRRFELPDDHQLAAGSGIRVTVSNSPLTTCCGRTADRRTTFWRFSTRLRDVNTAKPD